VTTGSGGVVVGGIISCSSGVQCRAPTENGFERTHDLMATVVQSECATAKPSYNHPGPCASLWNTPKICESTGTMALYKKNL